MDVALHQSLRSGDYLGRVGGDEFHVIAPETTMAGAVVLTERIHATMALHVQGRNHPGAREHRLRRGRRRPAGGLRGAEARGGGCTVRSENDGAESVCVKCVLKTDPWPIVFPVKVHYFFSMSIGQARPTRRIRVPSYRDFRPATAVSSRVMQANRRQDTQPEVMLRRQVWRLGLRYRKNVASLPGQPDMVFHAARVVVFCDGDFWHGRDWKTRRRKLRRGANAAYWTAKIARNIQRDQEHTARLNQAGWLVIRLWEAEIKQDLSGVARLVARAVMQRRGEVN